MSDFEQKKLDEREATMVAIVGTSYNMTENEERDVRQTIAFILKDYNPNETTIISGGAKGVDTLAKQIAESQGFNVKTIPPKGEGWEFNRARNIEIANQCDELFCISIPYYKNTDRIRCYHHTPHGDHQKTAGCFTMNKALEQKKLCKLIVTQQRYADC